MSTIGAEQKLSEILTTQHELQEQSEEIRRLMEIEEHYESVNKAAMVRRKEIEEAQSHRAKLDLSTPEGAAEAVKIDRCIAAMQKELADHEKRLADLSSATERLRYIVDNNKNFDKSILFRNIRKLLGSTGVKIGQIERDAHCQPGYMSRLEKAGNTTDPTVEFVVTAAKALNVSVDLLVYSDLGRMTETELYILKFLNNLTKDTKDDLLHWKINNMGRYVQSGPNVPAEGDPIFNYLVAVDFKTDAIQYESLFINKTLRCTGNCYMAELKGTAAMIYIMNCVDDSAKQNEVKQFYELYIVSEKKVNPLLSTAQAGETLTRAVSRLFEAVEISATHLHINDDVRTIIDIYLNPVLE